MVGKIYELVYLEVRATTGWVVGASRRTYVSCSSAVSSLPMTLPFDYVSFWSES